MSEDTCDFDSLFSTFERTPTCTFINHRGNNTRGETSEPIMIQTCSALQNERLNFSFVKDIVVVVKRITKNCCTMIKKWLTLYFVLSIAFSFRLKYSFLYVIILRDHSSMTSKYFCPYQQTSAFPHIHKFLHLARTAIGRT